MKKRHEVVVVIRADKACTKAAAIAAVRDTIHGEFYPYSDEIETFKIASVKGGKGAGK